MAFLSTPAPPPPVAGTTWSSKLRLCPPGTSVELRTYGFGWMPFDGNFTRLDGWIGYNPSNQDTWHVMLKIEVESLAMMSEPVRDRIVGPEMMDAARFPELVFEGTSKGTAVIGDLTMHGETHSVTLNFTRSTGTLSATGHLRRADWGITGSPLLGGPMIRIKVSAPNPFNALSI